MALGVAAVLGLWALIIVLRPLYGRRQQAAAQVEALPVLALAEREAAAKAALQDVEFDYQLGNLGEDDYQSLRERYTRRALAAMKGRYDRERALDDAIEEQVRALLAKSAARNGHREPATRQSGPAGARAEGAKRRGGHASNASNASNTGNTNTRKSGPSAAQRRHGSHGGKDGKDGKDGNGANGRGRS
jgi:hypothetical protein